MKRHRIIWFCIDTAIAFYLFLMPICFLATLLMLTIAETWQTRFFVLALLFFFPIPIILWPIGRIAKAKKALLAISSIFTISGIFLCLICYFISPSGKSTKQANIQSLFLGDGSYKKHSITNLVSEIDQLKLGCFLFRYVDPFISGQKSKRINNLFLHIYRDMRKSSSDFRNMGSSLNLVYKEILTSQIDTAGHIYTYLPKRKQPLPVILFLHGNMGNFKGYLWVWKYFAEHHNFAIVAPSFGMGNWDHPKGIEVITKALEFCKAHPKLNLDQIYLVGLSNGGKGVSRAILANNKAYQGVVYISAIVEQNIIWNAAFKKEILIVHGDQDVRISIKNIEQTIDTLKSRKFSVKYHRYNKQDHFLFFDVYKKVFQDIAKWVHPK